MYEILNVLIKIQYLSEKNKDPHATIFIPASTPGPFLLHLFSKGKIPSQSHEILQIGLILNP